jgi:cytochrome c biogenesis factor
MNPEATYESLQRLRDALLAFGGPYEAVLLAASLVLAAAAVLPQAGRWRGWFLTGMALLLLIGETVLAWFHWRLYGLAVVVSPDGVASGRVAVPLWVESEKLFVWALILAVLGVLMRRQRRELLPGVMLITAGLAFGAALLGRPFSEPLPGFFSQYYGYLQAAAVGGGSAQSAYVGMESARQFYYNAWYMWVHPPMLFLSYGAFAISFVATVLMIRARHSSYETTAYHWARFGYAWLTLGMLLGLPWALAAWQGESWWWSGKVNMSLMMWFLYTAYLHARLYLRRRGMWKTVAALGALSFVILVLTYLSTYVVPGAHSYAGALAAPSQAFALLRVGGVWPWM